MKNAKQVVLLGSVDGKRKGSDGVSFLAHEIEVAIEFKLPIVVANLDGDRTVDSAVTLSEAHYYTISVWDQPKIIMYALDNYAVDFASSSNTGAYYYKTETYTKLGL